MLKKFASDTGGAAFYNLSPKDVARVFSRIEAQIEALNIVTYIPNESGKAGEFRAVELKITSEKKWKVHAPKGYYVSSLAH